jgi:parallel beta-helix repeat protein
MIKKYLIYTLLFLSLSEITVSQTIRYVTTSGSGDYDGSSWNNAFDNTQLQMAIDEEGVTEIWVAAGVYYPGVDRTGDPYPFDERTKCFHLQNGVAIYGGFAGGEELLSDRNLKDNITILSGDIGTPGDNIDNCYHVVYNENVDNTAILDGFTIQKGETDSYNEDSGAGVYNDNSSPKLVNCTISDNYAYSNGGGIYNNNGSNPTLSNCLITNNSAANGGGICNLFYSYPTLNSCSISGNSASYGGGVYNYDNSSLYINNSIIWGNTAAIRGNQLYLDGGTAMLNNCCYANGTDDVWHNIEMTCTACINSDPKFVNHLDDFRISGNSPCIDAGNNDYNTEDFDIRGNDRIQTEFIYSIDMGAYEYSFSFDPSEPSIIYVNSNASGADIGTSWNDAYLSLQSALMAATSGYEIWVAAGTYYPTDGYDRSFSFQMKNGVAIYGGFSATDTLFHERNWRTNVTILSGDIGTPGYTSDNSFHVVYNSGVNNTAILDGFNIQKGEADDYYEDSGAGVYNTNSSPKLVNCTISDNYAYSNGSGVFNTNSSPEIINCFISNNNGNYGAGIYNIASSPLMINCQVDHNSAMGPGGGITNEGSSSPTLTNCTLSGNTSMAYGGGIFNSSSSVMLNNSIIWGNNSIGSGYQIYVESGTVTLNYSCFANVINDTAGTITIHDGCITTDPLFINPGALDYRISANSPSADAGNDVYNSEFTDIRGSGYGRKLLKTDAYSPGPIDMGAFEYKKGIDPDPVMQIIYVDASKTSGYYDGTSWDNAYNSLQTALYYAENYSEIWVAAGTYKPTEGNDRNISFHLKNDVTIYGGFAGTETLRSERNWSTHITILSGDIGIVGNNTDNTYHVIYNYNANTAILDGFTIRGGNAFGSSGYGGGVYNEYSSPTLANCIITGNNAPVGAGIYNYNFSFPTFINCLIYGNEASGGWGGGMYNYYYSSPTLSNCTLSGNTSTQYGGGMVNNYESSPNIYNSIIWGNTATTNGNQIYNDNSAAKMYYTCYSNGTGDVFISSGTVTADANCITSAPMFVNAAGGDYRINGISPCKNTGSNGYSASAYDLRGQIRIQDTTIDMGAYEWTSGIDPTNVITWTGAVSSNWSTAGNWNPAIIPSSSDEVIIPDVLTSDPVVNESPASPAMCGVLIINTGAVLNIAAGKKIIVTGTFTSNE